MFGGFFLLFSIDYFFEIFHYVPPRRFGTLGLSFIHLFDLFIRL